MITTHVRKYILWDSKRDGDPYANGAYLDSGGILGRIGDDNVYLASYAQYPDASRPKDLQIGESIRGVIFRLSGEKGTYDVIRVE